jgi:hypothetical protein
MTGDSPTYLWLTRWPPYPPRLGGDVDYSRELILSLSKCAPVRVLAFGNPAAPTPADGVDWRLVAHQEPPRVLSMASRLPNVAFRHLSRAYLAAAVKAAVGTQAVLVDFISMLWIVAPLRAALRRFEHPPRIVVVNHNFEHGVRLQMVAAEESPPMKALLAYDTWKAGRLERGANRIADALVANTPADAARFAEITDKPAVVVLPGYAGERVSARVIDAAIPPRICITGNHEAQHKRMVLERALAALAKAGMERRYPIDVVGAGDVGDLADRYPGFNHLGYVDDLGAYLTTVRLALVPDDIGGGFKHRVLTHIFHRTPLLAVRWAVNGMGLRPDTDFAVAEDLTQMAAMVPELIDDFPRLNRLQTEAYRHCDDAYDWGERGRSLHAFIQALPPTLLKPLPKSGETAG